MKIKPTHGVYLKGYKGTKTEFCDKYDKFSDALGKIGKTLNKQENNKPDYTEMVGGWMGELRR